MWWHVTIHVVVLALDVMIKNPVKMPWKRHATRANIQNIQNVNQKMIKTKQDEIKSESVQCLQNNGLAVAAQSDLLSTESTPSISNFLPNLDPDLADFCTWLHITPDIREFRNDERDSNTPVHVSDQSSNIEEISALKRFTQAFQTSQVIALKSGNKKKGDHIQNDPRKL